MVYCRILDVYYINYSNTQYDYTGTLILIVPDISRMSYSNDNDNDNDNEIDLFRHHNGNNTYTKVIFKQMTAR